MRALGPTAGEAALLHFSFGSAGWPRRRLAAGLLFAAGLALWALLPLPLALFGLVVILAGHVPLWVRSQTTAPGGATPAHEEVWVPVEEGWLDRLREHEARGERWDVSPFDLSSGRGCGAFAGVLAVTAVLAFVLLGLAGPDAGVRLGAGALALLAPLWVNGMRTTWNPSELHKKGKALEAAVAAATTEGLDDFDVVPMLALREGRRGKYPVDAKVMLRPKQDDVEGFLGVQLQVAINSVQGVDYPYLYAVVLGRPALRLPSPAELRKQVGAGGKLVIEEGEGDDVHYLVLRQHADTKGGWHTDDSAAGRIARTALWVAREVRARYLAEPEP